MDDLENELGLPAQLGDNVSPETAMTKTLKAPKLPLPEPFIVETPKETGFHRTTRLCLERIREAMLHHRWQEAAEYMAYYPQMLEDTTAGRGTHYREIIWRLAIEILHHHPNSKMDDYNIIYERMKHSGVKHYLMICLEHSFHLLLHGQIENAKRHLNLAESWRYGKESTENPQKTKLIQAYRSLLDYIIWCEKKNALCSTDFTNLESTQDMRSYFRQASVNLKEILKCPGVWDSFILSYVEMLEFYDAQEEAIGVLEDYAYDTTFPANPNAHVYLYQYLERHNTSARKLMKVLKILHSLVPSHELMLDYISFLLLSDEIGDINNALEVVLDMLDYACWRTSMDAWNCLKDVIEKLQSHDDWKEVVADKMAARKEWWAALHFTKYHATEDAEQRPQLMEVKASLTKILFPELALTYPDGPIISGEGT